MVYSLAILLDECRDVVIGIDCQILLGICVKLVEDGRLCEDLEGVDGLIVLYDADIVIFHQDG